MGFKTNDTALLLFSRTALQESASKKLVAGNKKQNFIAIKNLIERSKGIAKQSGLPLFIHTEQQQRGNTFGEKLQASINDVFEKGFEKIIIIGNDCPQLSLKQIDIACVQLENFHQVLAPTNNGGVYLMGFTKNRFYKEMANIRWQTENVYDDLKKLAALKNATVYHLTFLSDVNNYVDLTNELSYLSAGNEFKILILSFLSSFKKTLYKSTDYFKKFLRSVLVLRGPPAINLL